MRLAVLLLLVANVLVFAYVRIEGSAGREPERLSDQLDPSAIRLLSAREAAALGVAVARESQTTAPATAPATTRPAGESAPSFQVPHAAGSPPPEPLSPAAPSTAPASAPPASAPPASAPSTSAAPASGLPASGARAPPASASRAGDPATLACLEWGPFSDAERARAEAELATSAPGAAPTRRPVHLADAWWVNVGAITARPDAEKRAGALRARAVDDLSVVDYGASQVTVSLGVYRTEAAATARVRALAARGVSGLRVEPWKQPITLTMLWLRDPSQSQLARLVELQARYAGTELKAIACPVQP